MSGLSSPTLSLEFDIVSGDDTVGRPLMTQEVVLRQLNNLSEALLNPSGRLLSMFTDDQTSKPPIDLPFVAPVRSRRSTFVPLHEWEGYVTDLQGTSFVCRVRPVGGDKVEEEVEFPTSDLSVDDLKLLRVGAVFRWVVGHERRAGGQLLRASQIVFRRLPAWSRGEVELADARAADRSERLEWD